MEKSWFAYLLPHTGIFKKPLRVLWLPVLFLLLITSRSMAQQIQETALRQIQSLIDEKESRTPIQKKISSQILYAAKMKSGVRISNEVSVLKTVVVTDENGRVKVDIKAAVTPQLLNSLTALGGEIIFSSEKFGSIVAWIPLDKMEQAAAPDAVTHIGYWIPPAVSGNSNVSRVMDNFKPLNAGEPQRIKASPQKNNVIGLNSIPSFETRAANVKKQITGALLQMKTSSKAFAGSVTSEGDVVHKAAIARSTYNADGTGVKIGVLSDGVDGYADSQASGDLPAVIHILPGQQGAAGLREGRAMMEIVHDLAPGADLYFATAFTSEASFAQNILDLRAAGCDIIVDDVVYYKEAVFQDDDVARAVNSVTASGALYFSMAYNAGSKKYGTAGVWEGDFNDAFTSSIGNVTLSGGTIHSFSPGINYDEITGSANTPALKWSDPLGASSNDYDLYILDNAMSGVAAASTDVQDGNDDPVEMLPYNGIPAGFRFVIFKKTGAARRALHLNTNLGRLSINTNGQTFGHNAAASAITVAATPAFAPYPNPFDASDKVETFSSDGPRRIFYTPDGLPITDGNLLFGTNGGRLLQKPDITAADGVSTATPGFTSFFGTSAAGPHAAAIAGLVKSKYYYLSPAQIRTALVASTIDIEDPGVDANSGAGIIMADAAMQVAGTLGAQPNVIAGSPVVILAENASPLNNAPDPGETLTVNLPLKNISGANTSNLVATLIPTGGVTNPGGMQLYGVLTAGGPAVSRPFTFTANGVCGGNITLTLSLQDGFTNLGTVSYTLQLGVPGAVSGPFTFSNPTNIDIPATGSPVSPYPSTINVSGLTGKITKLTVALKQFNHASSADVDVLLVSPTGQKMTIMSDVGGTSASTNVDITLDDAAANFLPASIISSGSYKPTNYPANSSDSPPDAFPAPAPAGPYQNPYPTGNSTLNNVFGAQSPNGVWSLYVADGFAGNSGNFNGGWSLSITTAADAVCAIPQACTNTNVVTNLNDAGAGSLRQAILNTCAGGTISFQSGLTGTMQLSNPLVINKGLTIAGPMLGGVNLNGGAAVTVFDVENASASPFTVNISGLSMVNGAGSIAGAITHSITSVTPVTLNVAGCTFLGNNFNSMTAQAAAVFSNDSLHISNCIFAANSLSSSDPNARAGAIYANGPFTIVGSTFNDNSTGGTRGSGGAVFGNNAGSIINSTFTTNSAQFGGAIYLNNFNAALTSSITNCTITGNAVFNGGTGGGIDLNAGKLTMLNNIIAGNTTTVTHGPDVLVVDGQTVTSLGHNIIGNGDGSTGFTNGVNGDMLGNAGNPVNPMLSPMGNYGGPTQTFALLPGSPAINAGGNAGAPAIDQRGVARPQQSITDIGAFESRGFDLTVTSGDGQATDINTAFANPLKVSVTSSFNEPVNGGTITFTAPSSGASASIAGNIATITGGTATSGTVTANGIAGQYNVTANTSGANAAANFSLTNKSIVCVSTLVQPYISSINTGNQTHRGELAFEFHVNNPNGIDVKQLGAFDDNGDGINGLQPGGGVRVAIFSKTTHQIVPGLDATIVGNADAYTGLHRMKNITPVNLPQGDYLLVAKGYGPGERNGNLGNGGGPYPEGSRGNNDISFLDEAAYGPDDPNGFNYPSVAGNFGSNHPFLAGTFAFTTSSMCAPVTVSADLSNLTISAGVLSPSFATATTTYSDAVENNIATVKVTPTAVSGATLTVNGQAVTNGSPSQSIPLTEGSNTISIVVTSGDGTATKTYTITVIRATSGGCTAPASQAYIANTSAGNQGYGGELGMEFTVNKASGIIINQLGAFDDGGNGITGTQSGGIRVAVFNRNTHQIVNGLDVNISGSADPLISNHRMRAIAPVTLPAGDYVIVAKGYNNFERNGNVFSSGTPYPTGDDGGGAISYGVNSSYGPDDPAGFNYPAVEANFGSNHIYLAGTFSFTTVIPCGGGTCESAPAQAYTSNTNTGSQAYTGELGMEFIVNNAAGINIKQLGAFDDGGNGITGTQAGGVRVAVFNRSTQKIVPGLDVTIIGNGDAYTGFHQMKNITPVTLPRGDYMIVAKGYNTGERNGNVFSGGGLFPDGDNGGGAISFGQVTAYGPDNINGFNYPSNEGNYGNTHVYLAGTFDYTLNISCPPSAARITAFTTIDTAKSSGLASADKEIKIYPNPTRGRFNLQLANVTAPELKIDILNASGQLIAQKTVHVLTGTALLNVEFNLLNQVSGIYLIKVQSIDGIKTKKLVIQR